MLIVPAIDIKDGKVVRLIQGKFQEITVYSDNPISVAREWVVNGAPLIHVVDLDGALTGQIKNLQTIKEIVKDIEIPVQVGGGIRDKETITNLLKMGVARVVLSTKAIEDKKFLKEVIDIWPERIVVGIDSSHGMVFKKGWTSPTMLKPIDLARQVQAQGVTNIIYTDISKDGTLKGPNIKGIRSFLEAVNISVFASGGISCLDDVKTLKTLEKNGLSGVIIGKALYERKMVLREAIKYAS